MHISPETNKAAEAAQEKTMSNQETLLNNVVVIQFRAEAFSGKRTMDLKEVGVDVTAEDEKVVSKAGKYVVDAKRINVFASPRSSLHSWLECRGTKLMGGYAIPSKLLTEAKTKLLEFEQLWEAEGASFCSNYDSYVAEWAAMNPKWAGLIQSGAPALDRVKGSFKFGYSILKLNLESVEGTLLNKELEELDQQIVNEVAKDISSSCKATGDSAKGATRDVLRRAAKKLADFGFLNPKMLVASKMVLDAVDALPKTGPLKGPDFWAAYKVIDALKDASWLSSPAGFEFADQKAEAKEQAVKAVNATVNTVSAKSTNLVDLLAF